MVHSLYALPCLAVMKRGLWLPNEKATVSTNDVDMVAWLTVVLAALAVPTIELEPSMAQRRIHQGANLIKIYLKTGA